MFEIIKCGLTSSPTIKTSDNPSSSSQGLYNFSFSELAEFVTVDYLWDNNHSRSIYEESGEFVVSNNIIAGIKVSYVGDIYVTVP
jgi:hypothetical protein